MSSIERIVYDPEDYMQTHRAYVSIKACVKRMKEVLP